MSEQAIYTIGNNQPMFVTFKLYCNATRVGEIVKVSGNCP